ncbi:MAG: hypothetical protein ACYS0G_09205 [Planctomycetota bacterium]|jgi:hypothetical protein
MARKASNPALYELIRARRAAAAPPPETEPVSDAPVNHAPGWLSPGRTLRIPVGFLLLAVAALIASLVIAYMVGYTRAERAVRAELEQDWLARPRTAVGALPPEVSEPVVPDLAPGGVTPTGAAEGPGRDERAAPAPNRWGPILSDPRRPGQNYFVLIHTRRDSAVRLARFCREQELEAYAVAAKNVSLYRVIALPGYDKGERDSEAVRALERRIVEVARKWKLQVNPRDDLAYYPEKFEG